MGSSPIDIDAELDAIRTVVAAVEHSQRNGLVDEYVALFRDDAMWTTGGGRRLYGRAAIAEFTASALPNAMNKDVIPSLRVEHIQFVRPDVAVVKLYQQHHNAAGEPVGEDGTPLYVLAKEQGRWLLVASQNTPATHS